MERELTNLSHGGGWISPRHQTEEAPFVIGGLLEKVHTWWSAGKPVRGPEGGFMLELEELTLASLAGSVWSLAILEGRIRMRWVATVGDGQQERHLEALQVFIGEE